MLSTVYVTTIEYRELHT